MSSNLAPHVKQKITEAKEKQLTELDLSNEYLTEIPAEVFELTQLEILNLNWNEIKEIPEAIKALSNLKELHLFSNLITNYPKNLLILLPNLIYLGITWNFEQKISISQKIITQIAKLGLDLRNNQLTTIPESITNLTNLTVLYLVSNLLSTVPKSITKLTNLTELYLGSNLLRTVQKSITKLTNLTELDLSNNQLTTVPESIGNLTNLTELDLSNNQLTTVLESIGNLTNLTELDLGNNQLTTIPKSIGNLTNLTVLDLGSNQLTTVPESIGNLTNLTVLDLWNNQLTTVPKSITNLTNLTELYLSDNQLTTVPKSITNLTNLTVLNLSDNQLTTVPESITNLTNLTELYLSYNQLSTVPESITNLTNLTELYLSYNQLSTVPESITNLTNLTVLDLSDNPLVTPPLNICKKGIEAIRNYYRQLAEEGFDYLYEAKLIIVGEGETGKTTLANKILNPDCELPNYDDTRGIDIIPYSFEFLNQENNLQKFRINIWDFGGQEIQYTTHQFFLTKRSLYILLVDNRRENANLNYWLNVVELLSQNSPILIVKNEKNDLQAQINETALKGHFTDLKEVLATNFKTNKNLIQVIDTLKHHIRHLPHIGEEFPKTWPKVREVLEKKREQDNYISLNEYLKICQENGVKFNKDSLQLSDQLHDLGICLHYQDDITSPLFKTVILKPEWATNGVYKVLYNEKVIQNFGKFTQEDLRDIWNDEKYQGMEGELLKLMMKFQLCYEIPEQKNTYIAPQLLAENQPDYEWKEENNLILRYEYTFMPKGIITQFIVIMHRLIYEQKYVWKNGVILADNETLAEVVESYDQKEIKIRVEGKSKKELLTKITYELDKIHGNYKNLKYQKLVPCNCEVCKNNQEPNFYEYEELKDRIKYKDTIDCKKSRYKPVPIRKLIDDIIDYEEQKKLEETDANNKQQTINNFNNCNLGDMHMNNVSQSHSGSGDNVAGDKNETNYNIKDNEIMNDKIEIKDSKIGVVKNEGGIKGNAKIAGVINEGVNANSEDKINQVAKALENLLDYFEQNPKPTLEANNKVKEVIDNNPEILEAEILEQAIDNTPTLQQRLRSAGKATYIETIKFIFPFMGIPIEAIKAFNEPK